MMQPKRTKYRKQFKGRIRVESYVGDFCLGGNASDGFSPADVNLPATRCDLVGNPFEDSLPNAQRQSLAFANLMSSLRQEGGLTVEVAHEGRRARAAAQRGGGARVEGRKAAAAEVVLHLAAHRAQFGRRQCRAGTPPALGDMARAHRGAAQFHGDLPRGLPRCAR